MNDALSEAICVKCRSRLRNFRWPSAGVTCTDCETTYPLVGDKIPILVDRADEYLATTYLYYERYLKAQEDEIRKLGAAASANLLRMPILCAFQEAIRRNAALVKTLQEQIGGHLSVNAMAAAAAAERPVTEGSSYLTTLSYLQRDWGGSAEGESELRSLEGPLFAKLQELSVDAESMLVLGAGSGRIALDLCKMYRRVYALDMSLTMVYQFYELLTRDVEFFELSANNLRKGTDAVRRHVASLRSKVDQSGEGRNLSYFVGDAQNIPLPDHSLSAIVSIYFTDVVPLRNLWPEVKRTLKEGGVFAHIGPLEYHFVDLSDSLAADEIRNVFTTNGFSIVHEAEIPSTHLRSSVSMAAQFFDNWFLVARRDPPPPLALGSVITYDSVLKVTEPLRFESAVVLSPQGEDVVEMTLVLPSGERYHGAGTVLDILRIIDGRRSTRQVIEILSQDYEIADEASSAAILRTLATLVDKGALEISLSQEQHNVA